MNKDIFNERVSQDFEKEYPKIKDTISKEFDSFIEDTLLFQKHIEHDENKKIKLMRKVFRNFFELEEFVNKRKISRARIVNIQHIQIQNAFSEYYELIYYK